jgi:flagella basal body P-ring formation protein FlgA
VEIVAIAALAAALALPGGRAELVALEPSLPAGCAVASAAAPRPFAASGRVALRLEGTTAAGARCEGWAWARVRVLAPALVVARDVADGAPIAGAAEPQEREVLAGRPPLATLPPGATASRALAAGTVLEPQHVRVGPRPGEPVAVVVRVGAIEAEQPGRAVACARGRACALLPSGRRVEGVLDGGRLVVESP